MGHQYAAVAFTEQVKNQQTIHNSRSGYASMESGEDYNHFFSQTEADFIHQRDSFYMASVSETQWPYVQHRGGAKGFLKVLDAKTLGFADFSGNKQYISTGNFKTNDRVSLFLMDYPNRRRLKILGRIKQLDDADLEAQAALEDPEYRARIERSFVITLEAFDWNCPQHITPRYDASYIENLLSPLKDELTALRNKNIEHEKTSAVQNYDVNPVLGDGDLTLVVSGIRQLTPRIRAFEFKSLTGQPLPKITAGAHLRLPVLIDPQEPTKLDYRHYSICSNPARRDIYEVAVLSSDKSESQNSTEAAMKSGSEFIHTQYQLGTKVALSEPDNFFTAHDGNEPAVLIAGGIGITPIKSIAQSLTAQGNDIQLHYAGRQANEMAFSDRLMRTFSSKAFFYRSDKQERLNLKAILSNAPENAIFYCCGPETLLNELASVANQLGIAANRIRTERFQTPSITLMTSDDRPMPVTLNLERSNKTIEVSENITLLDALLDNGVVVANSCKSGQCRSCAIKVIAGKVEHNDHVLTPEEKAAGLMCPCVSRAHTHSLTLDI